MNEWYETGRYMKTLGNVELIEGNAIQLSKLVPHADVIILHNVLLDLTGDDTKLMWQYKRGEKECSDEQWANLIARFNQAEEQGYKEFLKVADHGYIVVFRRPDENNEFITLLTARLGIDPKRINKEELFYDSSTDKWELFVIDNTTSEA